MLKTGFLGAKLLSGEFSGGGGGEAPLVKLTKNQNIIIK